MESQLAISGTVSKVRERGGVSFVGFDLEVSDDYGPVAGGSSLFLISGESAVATSVERPEPAPEDRGSPGSGQVAMSRADLVKYAAATRDWNPIHWDHEAAVEAGLPGVVVHGLAQASWALAAAARLRAGDRPLASARIRFRNPLLPAVPVRVDAEETDGVARVAVIDGETEYLSARIQLAEE
jgi:acyl dehydratase